MFNRQSYLDKLIQAKDSDFVKVLTGILNTTRSAKTTSPPTLPAASRRWVRTRAYAQ